MKVACVFLAASLCGVSPERSPATRAALPWVERDVWLHSAVGRRLPPETLVTMAASEEARRSWYRAYCLYRRVLSDYKERGIPQVLAQAYLGLARCLVRIGESRRACRLLLERTVVGEPLHQSEAARGLLESLLEDEEVRLDRALHARARRRAASLPKPGPVVETHDAASSVPERDRPSEELSRKAARGKARQALETARFYLKRDSVEAATVYLRYVVVNYPHTPEAQCAAFLLATRTGKRGERKERADKK